MHGIGGKLYKQIKLHVLQGYINFIIIMMSEQVLDCHALHVDIV